VHCWDCGHFPAAAAAAAAVSVAAAEFADSAHSFAEAVAFLLLSFHSQGTAAAAAAAAVSVAAAAEFADSAHSFAEAVALLLLSFHSQGTAAASFSHNAADPAAVLCELAQWLDHVGDVVAL